MSSINLLPVDFRLKGEQERERVLLILVGVFLILASTIVCLGVYLADKTSSKELNSLKTEIKKIDIEIKNEASRNEVLLIDNKAEDILELLLQRSHFSQSLEAFQYKLVDGVYFNDYDLSKKEKGLFLEATMVAQDYYSVAEQIAVLRNYFWVENVEIGSISSTKKEGITFVLKLKLRKELIHYHEPYWNRGLVLLIEKVDRYLKISEYNVVLEKTSTGGIDEKKVKMEFSGVAYQEKSLVLFKKNFEKENSVSDFTVFYDTNKKDDSGIIKFEGSFVMDYLE